MQTGSMLLTGQNLSKQFKGLLAVSGVDIRIARGDRRPDRAQWGGQEHDVQPAFRLSQAHFGQPGDRRRGYVQGQAGTHQQAGPGAHLPARQLSAVHVRARQRAHRLPGRPAHRPRGRKRAGTGHRAGHCAVRPGRARERHCPQPAARPAAPGEHGHGIRGAALPAVPGRAADRLEPDRGGQRRWVSTGGSSPSTPCPFCWSSTICAR